MPRKKSKKNIPVLPKLWILCEGTKTEINYLQGYIKDKHCNNRRVSFIRIPKVPENTPKSLVKKAVNVKKSAESKIGDIFWVAYDRESPAKYSDELHSQALSVATNNGVNVALTNVCIEMWLLLHFGYTTASYNSCDDLLRTSKFKAHCKALGINSYDKGCSNIYERFKPYVKDAISNAEKLENHNIKNYQQGTPSYNMNPYTDFHKILEAIDVFVR